MDIKKHILKYAQWSAFFSWFAASLIQLYFNYINIWFASFQIATSITFVIVMSVSYWRYARNRSLGFTHFMVETTQNILPWYGLCGFVYLICLIVAVLR